MNREIKKLLILSSGGDSPGMNAAIRSTVRTALHYKLEIFGTEMGYSGLMKHQIFPLDSNSVANIIMRGGTILKTGRSSDFYQKSGRDHCREFLSDKGIDAVIVLGGNGSFAGARLLEDEGGPRVIGIPCTIDNDIVGTEYTIGFDTACNTAVEAIDKIRDTAFSLERNFIIEIMGRESGFMAVDVGLAGGAELILVPEFPISIDQIIKKLQQKSREKLGSLIVAAESGEPNSSIKIAKAIKEKSGVEYKVCILGHIQRGGSPSVRDRKIGALMGEKAIEALMNGQSKVITAIQNGKLTITPFPDAKHATRFLENSKLLELNEMLCEI